MAVHWPATVRLGERDGVAVACWKFQPGGWAAHEEGFVFLAMAQLSEIYSTWKQNLGMPIFFTAPFKNSVFVEPSFYV